MGLLGGYKEHENHNNDLRVQKAADFAAKEIAKATSKNLKLSKVQTAHSQVVAGMNYKLGLELANDSEKKVEKYEATVYEPLGGEDLQLSDYKSKE